MNNFYLTRRAWLKRAVALSTVATFSSSPISFARADDSTAQPVIDITSRRELFLDDFLIAKLDRIVLKAHTPEPRDVAITCDAPVEGNTSAYYSIFADGDKFRMYYRGSHWDVEAKKEAHPEFACYAGSNDGLKFTKPHLGMVEFNGSKENNIVLNGDATHCFTPFKDANPDATPEARYKALARVSKRGLAALQSSDGIRWSLIKSEPVITAGAFDSQNLAFWDSVRGEYRAYWRIFSNKVRAIRTATSKDFLHWQNQADLTYVDSPIEHLYTNAIQPYFRAPHLFVGFPTRFQPKNQQVEPVFMSSRDGLLFKRWPEPLIPITAPQDRDGNRSNYMTWGLLQLPGQDRELSLYATEAYYAGPGSRVRRFVMRTDGFVSARADGESGELLTKPFRFTGKELEINYRVTPRGNLQVELQDAAGKPIADFALANCAETRGDEISRVVRWKAGADVSKLAGQPVRLRFVMKEADLFAIQFK